VRWDPDFDMAKNVHAKSKHTMECHQIHALSADGLGDELG